MGRCWALLAILSCLVATPAFPDVPLARPLSLQDCLRMALADSPTLALASARVALARDKLAEVQSKRSISFDLRTAFGVVPNNDNGDGLGPFIRNELTLTQPVYTFGKIAAGRAAAQQGILASEQQARVDRNRLVYEVTRLYFSNLLAIALQDLATEAQGRLAKALAKAQELYDQNSPKVTQKDLAKLKVFTAKLASQVLAARTAVQLTRDALAIAIGLEDPASLDLGDAQLRAPEVTLLELPAYRERGLASRPEIEALRRGIDARDALVRVERRKFLPDLAVVGNIKYAFAPERTVQNDDPNVKDDFNVFNYGAAFGMRLSLGFLEQRSRLHQAQADLGAIRSQHAQAEQLIGLEIEKAFLEAVEARDRIQATRDGLKAARGWMVAETQLYQIGTGDTKDLLEALSAYAETKKDNLEALQKLQLALAELNRTIGQDPDLGASSK